MVIALRVIIFLVGLALINAVILSALRTFILPRSARDTITRVTFRMLRRVFDLFLPEDIPYARLDNILAHYAPAALLLLIVVWLGLVLLGYASIYWALGVMTWVEAFYLSGSALFTLGFAVPPTPFHTVFVFSEAALGLILVALLIAYLPTIYTAFSQREALITLLEVRAGSPPSAIELFARYNRLHRFEALHDLWEDWEVWFAQIEESHTSLTALIFFRSPQPDHSWITAAGAVLDAAALAISTIDIPHDVQADLCIRAGYLALRRIADFFGIRYNMHPAPTDPIQITRAEFDAACEHLAAQGVPLKPDRDAAWRAFAGWRVNYDTVLIRLCAITAAPYAQWSSDRTPQWRLRKR